MRSVLAGLVAAVTVAAGVVGAGCVLVTGSTDGYQAATSGGDGGGDGAPISFQCATAADCGDGGDVCCLVVNSSLTSATTVCQAAPCPQPFPVQLCGSTPECGKEGGLCTRQTCALGSVTVRIFACGDVPGCMGQ
jgi:hypothetical protein